MTIETRRGRGRPANPTRTVSVHVRFPAAHAANLAYLRSRWGATDTDAIRRAVAEASERERDFISRSTELLDSSE